MNFPGAEIIGIAQAREILSGRVSADVLRDDLMLEEPEDGSGVLRIPGGTTVFGGLALDWENAVLDGKRLRGLLVDGDVTIDGDITSANWDGGPFLAVTGRTSVRHIFKRGAPIVCLGPLEATGSIYCEYNHGCLRALGGLKAQALIIDDHCCELRGTVDAIVFDTRQDDPRTFLLDRFWYEEDDGEVFLVDDIAEVLISEIRGGNAVFRADAPRRSR